MKWPRLTPRGLRLALIASLAANLALAGMMAGRALGPDARELRRMPLMLRALPQAERDALRHELRGEMNHHARRSARRVARAALSDAVAAEPFDPAALTEALRARRKGNDRVARKLDAGFARVVAQMTPQARAELATRLRPRR